MSEVSKMKEYPKNVRTRSLSYAKDEAWKAFAYFIRVRDGIATTGRPSTSKCITCEEMSDRRGNIYNAGHYDAGHFIAGRGNAYLFDERCVHAQCKQCNRNGGEGAFYYLAMIRRYGRIITETIMGMRHQHKRYTVFELWDIEQHYREEAKKLITNYRASVQSGYFGEKYASSL